MKQLNAIQKEALKEFLLDFITEERKLNFEEKIKSRTQHVCVALENIYQAQNASAVLRTCDCFGIQDVHIIEDFNEYNINPTVALGSDKWLNLKRYNKENQNCSLNCISHLREQGYTIAATTPHTDDVLLTEYPIDNKTALFFGTELKGLSKTVMENADVFIKIPMYGFTESYNISVSAAISIFHLTEKLRKSNNKWKLNRENQNDILIQWLQSSINNSDLIIQKYLSDNNLSF
jgi:tRNA (guanosine-2'-O-)-methyltransferase